MKKCVICGEVVEDGHISCPNCGKGIFESEEIRQYPDELSQSKSDLPINVTIYCFLLRASGLTGNILRSEKDKAEWLQSDRTRFELSDQDLILFDVTDWDSPVLPPQSPEHLKGALHSLDTSVQLMNAIEQSLIKKGLPVNKEDLYSNSVVETFPASGGSIAKIWYSPSLSAENLKTLMRQGRGPTLSLDRDW